MSDSTIKAAEAAVLHILKRIKADPRLAYLIGPGSSAFELLMEAGAAIGSLNVVDYEKDFCKRLQTQKVPGIGRVTPVLDDEMLARIAVYDCKVHRLDDQDDLNMLVNHFVRRGLDVAEAERDTQTEELF
jgi:hypothetical protein